MVSLKIDLGFILYTENKQNLPSSQTLETLILPILETIEGNEIQIVYNVSAIGNNQRLLELTLKNKKLIDLEERIKELKKQLTKILKTKEIKYHMEILD